MTWLLLLFTRSHLAESAGSLGMLTSNTDSPVVTKTTMGSNLLQLETERRKSIKYSIIISNIHIFFNPTPLLKLTLSKSSRSLLSSWLAKT